MTKTVSLRLKPHQIEEIKVAALAANLPVATYLYRRVTDTPILSTPALAALAKLVGLLHKLEINGRCDLHALDELRALVRELSQTPIGPDASK
ncbi:hypothetical protein WJT74_06400 [Sphingomicrobium sp. XHP0239]|uniref:hypothetical protein n=1 Tax=Sphingomicrobium maritimum TaxID=3133972 RepID=UPI0031CCC5EB